MSRLVDLVVALPLALLSLPVIMLLALFVLVIDGRPIFHRDPRLGRRGEVFPLLKIRSMKPAEGAAVTAADDPRLRPWGRILRRHRLDELPQLWQVVAGTLALVGPRPESPRLVLRNDPRETLLLEHRPGLVDPAVLASLDEDAELAGRADPEGWYRLHMRPRKIELSLAWLEQRSLAGDLRLLLRAGGALLTGEDPVMMPDVGFDVELAAEEIAALLGRRDAGFEETAPAPSVPVMVTGAGGSIGSLLVRRLAALGARVIALDRAEAGLFRLGLRLREAGHDARVRLVVRDAACPSLRELLGGEEVGAVIHAAAHKHVGLMEEDEDEAMRNNVEKTGVLFDATVAAGVADFVLISTDKAVDPICAMGRSKAAAEDLVLERARDATRTRVMRLPNVLGSAGSVAQVFRRALLRGDVLLLRDVRAERLYLGPEEAMACLLAILARQTNGLFAPLAPPAIGLLELARRAHGLWSPDRELVLRDLGLGAGERLRESLLGRGETARPDSGGLMCITRTQDADADRRADERV